MPLIGTNIFSDVQCSDKNLMQYIILEHELNLSEELGKITFLECLKSTTINSSQVFPSIIFVFFMEFLRLKASESEEKNKVKELEDTQV